MKLIDQVKPEVLKSLENDCKIRYSSSYNAIVTSLNDVTKYRELTIKQVQNLLTFLPTGVTKSYKLSLFSLDKSISFV